jgi:hypothetical protein
VDFRRYDLATLRFPATCCRCGAETASTFIFTGGRVWYLLVIERIIGHETWLELPVPFCDRCHREARRAWIRGLAIGTVASLAFVVVGAVIVGSLRLRSTELTMALGLSFFVGPIVGFVVGRRPDPVRLRAWRPKEETIEIAFENERFARETESASRA